MDPSSTDSANYVNYTISGAVGFSLVNDSSGSSSLSLSSSSSSLSSFSYAKDELNLPYALCEVIVAVAAVIGNGLVIIVFSKDRKLRRRTNYYIISLATADLLVGLFAIPFAILESIGLPTNLYACLFTVSVLVVLCTISIFCLVAVSVDRYWAILHPMGYSRNVRTKTAIGIICVCWIAGSLVGFLPLLGWNAGKNSDEKCRFVEVMDYDYLVFLYFATIIFPALLIAAFYAHIYRVVVKQLRQIVTMNPGRRIDNQTTGTMLRLLGAAQKRDVKVTQNLSRIVAFFIVCWFPLYTINCVQAFCPDCEVNDILLNFCIILSHVNSAGNPLLYAYHLKDFRAALQSFICGLLFPSSEPIKNNRELSGIMENRGSCRGSRRTTPRQNAVTGNARTPRTSLLRRATEGAAAPPPFSSRPNASTITAKPEIHPEPDSPCSSLSARGDKNQIIFLNCDNCPRNVEGRSSTTGQSLFVRDCDLRPIFHGSPTIDSPDKTDKSCTETVAETCIDDDAIDKTDGPRAIDVDIGEAGSLKISRTRTSEETLTEEEMKNEINDNTPDGFALLNL